MSWSVSIIGTPDSVVAKLDEAANTMRAEVAAQYNEVKPHLQALVSRIICASGPGNYSFVHLRADGISTFKDGKKTFEHLKVDLEPFKGELAP